MIDTNNSFKPLCLHELQLFARNQDANRVELIGHNNERISLIKERVTPRGGITNILFYDPNEGHNKRKLFARYIKNEDAFVDICPEYKHIFPNDLTLEELIGIISNHIFAYYTEKKPEPVVSSKIFDIGKQIAQISYISDGEETEIVEKLLPYKNRKQYLFCKEPSSEELDCLFAGTIRGRNHYIANFVYNNVPYDITAEWIINNKIIPRIAKTCFFELLSKYTIYSDLRSIYQGTKNNSKVHLGINVKKYGKVIDVIVPSELVREGCIQGIFRLRSRSLISSYYKALGVTGYNVHLPVSFLPEDIEYLTHNNRFFFQRTSSNDNPHAKP